VTGPGLLARHHGRVVGALAGAVVLAGVVVAATAPDSARRLDDFQRVDVRDGGVLEPDGGSDDFQYEFDYETPPTYQPPVIPTAPTHTVPVDPLAPQTPQPAFP